MSVVLEQALKRLITTAERKYGPFSSTHEALGVAVEEWDELRAAIHKNDCESIRAECLDLASVLIRLAIDLDNEQVRSRSNV